MPAMTCGYYQQDCLVDVILILQPRYQVHIHVGLPAYSQAGLSQKVSQCQLVRVNER